MPVQRRGGLLGAPAAAQRSAHAVDPRLAAAGAGPGLEAAPGGLKRHKPPSVSHAAGWHAEGGPSAVGVAWAAWAAANGRLPAPPACPPLRRAREVPPRSATQAEPTLACCRGRDRAHAGTTPAAATARMQQPREQPPPLVLLQHTKPSASPLAPARAALPCAVAPCRARCPRAHLCPRVPVQLAGGNGANLERGQRPRRQRQRRPHAGAAAHQRCGAAAVMRGPT